ncbi:MAG: hypothetical protein ABI596_15885 [Pyrinomonadaceae bacterium]
MIRTRKIFFSKSGLGSHDWLTSPRLIIVAAILHLAMTATIYEIGRHGVMPGSFDANGTAVSFAHDGVKYREETITQAELLRQGRIHDWLAAPSEFHVKLYAICFALFGPWLGLNILSAEPLNLLCYLAILILVFQVGRDAFDQRAGMIAAVIVGLWPSLLIHTTQLLKDPWFIAGMLAFILINLRLLSRSFSWKQALLTGGGGGLIALLVWFVRDNMGQLLPAAAMLGAAMLILRQLQERRFLVTNLGGMLLLSLMTLGATQVMPEFDRPDNPRTAAVKMIEQEEQRAGNARPRSGLAKRVGLLRRRFVLMYPGSGSNLDSNVQLNSTADVIGYLPRAAAIGFFAPFPNMWFASGELVGSSGRRLSGIETLAMYALEGLALVGLWKGRRRLPVWLLASIAATGVIALGLVVVNVGALYRLRYVFLILIIIIAAKAVTDFFASLRANPPEKV